MRNKDIFCIVMGVYLIGSALSMLFISVLGINPPILEVIGSFCVIVGVGIIIAVTTEKYISEIKVGEDKHER